MASAYRGGSAALHEGVGALMREASERAILPRYRQLAGADVADKAVDEPVTIADRESEAILAEGLARLIPEARIVGEEASDADPMRCAAGSATRFAGSSIRSTAPAIS